MLIINILYNECKRNVGSWELFDHNKYTNLIMIIYINESSW